MASRKSRASKRSKSRKSSSRKSSRSRKSKNPWIEFTKKHRASVVSALKKKKNYGEGKGQLKLQQDALKEMGRMYKERK